MKKEHTFIRFFALGLVVYIVIWMWPVFFHRPFFDPCASGRCGFNTLYPDPYYPIVSISPSVPPALPAYPKYDDVPVTIDIVPDAPAIPDDVVACTMDAKICEDGSAVGRQGPNCEFALCPEEK